MDRDEYKCVVIVISFNRARAAVGTSIVLLARSFPAAPFYFECLLPKRASRRVSGQARSQTTRKATARSQTSTKTVKLDQQPPPLAARGGRSADLCPIAAICFADHLLCRRRHATSARVQLHGLGKYVRSVSTNPTASALFATAISTAGTTKWLAFAAARAASAAASRVPDIPLPAATATDAESAVLAATSAAATTLTTTAFATAS